MTTTLRIDKRLVSLTAPDTFAAERYQGLRIKLEHLRAERGMQVIAITSPGAGDGKTVTSINLAGVLAREADARILLVDADLRRSTLGGHLGIEAGAAGLADLLSGSSRALADLVRRPTGCTFDVLPAGSSSRPVQKLFRSERLPRLLDEMRQRYDHVILDTPPLVPVFDTAVLSRAVEGVVIVVAAGRTPRQLLAAALDSLDASKVVGLVFNADSSPLFGYNNSAYRPYFSASRA